MSFALDIAHEAGDWDEAALVPLLTRLAAAVAPHLPPGRAALALGDDATVAALNARFRGKPAATNVLSFPARADFRPTPDGNLGDIILALETCTAEAKQDGKPFDAHVAHLALHGLLHLAGHDHDTTPRADAMEALERRILAELGIPDPYLETIPA